MNVIDPVCGMEFPADQAAAETEYGGRLYYFCAEACRRQFERNPHKYLGPDPP